MPVTPTILPLRYCIITNRVENINKIKLLFESANKSPFFLNSFNSTEEFLYQAVNGNVPDFIAVDELSFIQQGNDKQFPYPVILFSTAESTATDNQHAQVEEVNISTGQPCINKILARLEKNKTDIITTKTEEQVAAKKITKTFLTRKGREYVPLTIENIPAFYTDNKITFAFDSTGRKFMINLALIELENSLDPSMFFRANRQYLINRNFISRVRQLEEGRYEIIITAAEPIHVEINQQKFAKLKQWVEGAGGE